MKNILLILLLSNFLYSANIHSLNTKNINDVKSQLYSDITDENINQSISFLEAKKLKKSIDKEFDNTLSNYKYNLKNLALKIASLETKFQTQKDELQKNKTSLNNKISEQEAKEETISNIQKDIKNSKNNKISPNITNEFSTQGYYISAIKVPLSISNKEAKSQLQEMIINQSSKDLRGQFIKSIKIMKNSQMITSKVLAISSAKINIINTSSNNIYSFNKNGKKIVIYTTKVDLYPFEKSSKSYIDNSENSISNSKVFLIENKTDLKESILNIKNSFGISKTNIDKYTIYDELESINTHNDTTYNSIKQIINDSKNSKIKVDKRISLNKQKLINEKQSLSFIKQEVNNLKEIVEEKNINVLVLEDEVNKNKNKLKSIKSQQIYTRAMIRDKKSSNPKKDIKLIIDELVNEIDVSFKQTSREIEEILNKNNYSKTITKIKYEKSYISAQTIPYYVNGADSKTGAIVVLKVRFDGYSENKNIYVPNEKQQEIKGVVKELEELKEDEKSWYTVLFIWFLKIAIIFLLLAIIIQLASFLKKKIRGELVPLIVYIPFLILWSYLLGKFQ